MAVESRSKLRNRWFIDFVASKQKINNVSLLGGIVAVEDVVEVGEGAKIHIKGIGTLRTKVVADVKTQNIMDKDVAFVPISTTNLLSVRFLR